MSEVQILSPRLQLPTQPQLVSLLGAFVASCALFFSLPSFVLDLLVLFSLASSLRLLFSPPQPQLFLSFAFFRIGVALALLRASLSGDIGSRLLLAVGLTLPPVAFVVLVLATALVLGVVIARSLSRSAEVSARMALDALPGAQVALEADLRGQSDPLMPSLLRARLLAETQTAGGLDGAARIISGDALLAVLLGAILWLALWVQGAADALSQGLGLSALHLAAALPASAALLGKTSFAPRFASFSTAGFLLLLAFLPESPWPLVLLSAAAALVVGNTTDTPESDLCLCLPDLSWKTRTVLQRTQEQLSRQYNIPLPHVSLQLQNGPPSLRRAGRVLVQAETASEVLQQFVRNHLGVEEISQYLQQLAERHPASSRSIKQPFPQLVQSLQTLLREGYPLVSSVVANTLALAPTGITQLALEDLLRKALLPERLMQLGPEPWRALRLSGMLEFEIRSGRPLLGTQCASLQEQLRRQEIQLVLCNPETRRALALLLQETLVVSTRELPEHSTLLFLGELSCDDDALR